MPRSALDGASHVVQDAAYVTVGLGLLGFQRLQVRRRELAQTVADPSTVVSGAVDLVVTAVGNRFKVIEERLGAALGHR